MKLDQTGPESFGTNMSISEPSPQDQSPQDQNQTGPEIQKKRGGPYSKHEREVRRKIIQEHMKFNPRTNEYYVENKSELARLLGVNRHTIEADIKAIKEERLARFEEALRREFEAKKKAWQRLEREDPDRYRRLYDLGHN
jgi:hypothetical protein